MAEGSAGYGDTGGGGSDYGDTCEGATRNSSKILKTFKWMLKP